MILAGLAQSLEDALGLPVIFVASTDRMKLAARLQEMTNGTGSTIKWPLMFVHLNAVSTGIETQKHGYNTKSMARHGVYTQMDDAQSKVINVKLVPTVFDFEVVYMVDNFEAAFAFTTNWIAQATSNRANFSLTYGTKDIDIKVELAQSMQTPDMESSVDQPNVFEYTASLSVVGYVTDPHPDGQSDVQIMRKPVTNVSLGTEQPLDRHVWNARHTMPVSKDTK